jgi:hypothetical protein
MGAQCSVSSRRNVFKHANKDRRRCCKSDPNPFGFRNKNIHFGLDRIDKVVS